MEANNPFLISKELLLIAYESKTEVLVNTNLMNQRTQKYKTKIRENNDHYAYYVEKFNIFQLNLNHLFYFIDICCLQALQNRYKVACLAIYTLHNSTNDTKLNYLCWDVS